MGKKKTETTRVIGIDIGSISISMAELSFDGKILNTAYTFHNGDPRTSLTKLLAAFDLPKTGGIAVTSSTPDIVKGAVSFDSRISYISAAKHLNKKVGALLIVGGEKFGVVFFDEDGEYLNYKSNTSCAAGTGSFLDQQAKRLNLSGIEEFSAIACKNQGEIPKIASRCAVFAKTDLIHAQQEGHALEAICDGLSYGLAKNIVDVVFGGAPPLAPLLVAGGVSKNQAVVKHIARMLETDIIVDEYTHVYGAVGAALNLLEAGEPSSNSDPRFLLPSNDIVKWVEKEKTYGCRPLQLRLSSYPCFSSQRSYKFVSGRFKWIPPVEIDIYKRIAAGVSIPVFLGIDIGSTSTKAVLIDDGKHVLAGFYTRTAGRPVEAVQTVFESIEDFKQAHNLSLVFLGTGTTGSGRKFVAEIVGADVALDEITAHARAAFELDEEVDTIIEIGGQDSKFTTLRRGSVTFSIMNNVCAAGTGSFIEEQAKKLNCPLEHCSKRAEGIEAPISSDKCTVFMERDLNCYLGDGYSVDEILASILHSVRDNYLTKVAVQSNIGDKIFFQGATAKNKALVAAFEQKLEKPIMVSKYCHLTGALGVALHLRDDFSGQSSFRGTKLFKSAIPIRTEVCELCTNHCKIKIADINNETFAFGFLCDRDYDTKKYIDQNLSGFDLLKTRKSAFAFEPVGKSHEDFTIGLPAALHLFEELDLWKRFFDLLSIRTVSSEKYRNGLKVGKKLAGAEFCAPIAALHGHVDFLTRKADYIFLPDYFESKWDKKVGRRQYCYYTQFAPAVISSTAGSSGKGKILNPVVRSLRGKHHAKVQLYRMLKSITRGNISFLKVSRAYDKALEYHHASLNKLGTIHRKEVAATEDVGVVLVGRPYTILSPSMNNKIPEIFAKQGIKTFFQDMLDYGKCESAALDIPLKALHWNYAAKIMEATEIIAKSDGIYPVLVTSFKCTPDSFVIDAFKKQLDFHQKPYLILQLDEHDSNVGYETRIEAGIRAFRNHHAAKTEKTLKDYFPATTRFLKGKDSLRGKTLLMPNFDEIPCQLIEAVFRKEGIDARVMEESSESIKRSLSFNAGQCLPVNAMAQSCIDTIEKYDLDPATTAVWDLDSNIACNLGMFPHFLKSMLASYGKGMDKVEVYTGYLTYSDLSFRITYNAYFAHMFGGLLKKIGCKTRPYENVKGSTDNAIRLAVDILYDIFLNGKSKKEALAKIIPLFQTIETTKEKRPKIAVFGDAYARDNDVLNQNLVRTIEENGGEVITTPLNEYMKIIAYPFIKKWIAEGLYYDALVTGVFKKVLSVLDKKYYNLFNKIIREPRYKPIKSPEKALAKFNVKLLHTGEALETILKIFTLIETYPDISLFVQTSPALCCPSIITAAMADRIETLTGVPVVSIEYDGTGGSKNEDVIPYLKFPRKVHRAPASFS